MMLYQVHHQKKSDMSTEFVAQMDEKDYKITTVRELQKDHPLPDGCMWLVCTEELEHFLLAVEGTYEDVK